MGRGWSEGGVVRCGERGISPKVTGDPAPCQNVLSLRALASAGRVRILASGLGVLRTRGDLQKGERGGRPPTGPGPGDQVGALVLETPGARGPGRGLGPPRPRRWRVHFATGARCPSPGGESWVPRLPGSLVPFASSGTSWGSPWAALGRPQAARVRNSSVTLCCVMSPAVWGGGGGAWPDAGLGPRGQAGVWGTSPLPPLSASPPPARASI